MLFRGIHLNNEPDRRGMVESGANDMEMPPSDCGTSAESEAGSGLARLGHKLKSWYVKNGNLAYIPDIHLMSDDDRP